MNWRRPEVTAERGRRACWRPPLCQRLAASAPAGAIDRNPPRDAIAEIAAERGPVVAAIAISRIAVAAIAISRIAVAAIAVSRIAVAAIAVSGIAVTGIRPVAVHLSISTGEGRRRQQRGSSENPKHTEFFHDRPPCDWRLA